MADADRSIDPDQWLARHGDNLWAFAMLRLRDPDAASDAIQETFAAALRARESFSGRSSERTWLISILKHKIYDVLRRRSRNNRNLGRIEDVESSAEFDLRGAWSVAPGFWSDDASRVAERSEFWEIFHACLAELPSNLSQAFTLHELDGLKPRDVCEILGISPTNLNTRLYRARLLLRRSMEIRWFGRDREP